MVPILPGGLLDIIDSPLPILVGITDESYNMLQTEYDLESEFIESKTWVHLDADEDEDQMMNYN